MTTAHHVLTVTGLADDDGVDTREYEIECPGVTDECRLYEECGACKECRASSGAAFDSAESGVLHGVKHLHIDDAWMGATDRCYVASLDCLSETAGYLNLLPGRHPVTFDYVGDGWMDLHPVEAAEATS